MTKTLTFCGLVAVSVILAGCGRMGDLQPPQGATTRGPVEPATVNRPSSQQPIDGGPTNPYGGTAAGREPR